MWSGIFFTDVSFRSSLGRIGKRDECTLCFVTSFFRLTKFVFQPSQVANALQKSTDEVLDGMSEEMEKISSITAYIKPVMDYALAASEVGIGLPCFS